MPGMANMAGIPFRVTQDETGAWSARVGLWDGVTAHGEGDTADSAVRDCAVALKGLLEVIAEGLPGPEESPASKTG